MSYQESLSSVSDPITVKGQPSMAKPPQTHPKPNPLLFCLFCFTGNHTSHECWKFKSSELFWKKILEQRRCKNCLRLYHQSNKCYNKNMCNVMGCSRVDKHSTILCRQRYKNNFHAPKVHPHFSENTSRSHVSGPFVSKYRLANRYSNSFLPFERLYRKRRRKFSHGIKGYDHKLYQTKTGRSQQRQIEVYSVPSENLSIQTSEPVMFEQLQVPQKRSQSCQVEIRATKIEVSTQTPNWEKCKTPSVDKFSQASNTKYSSVGKSVQTSLLIPPSTDIFQYFPVFVNGKTLKSDLEVNVEVKRSSMSDVHIAKDHKDIFHSLPPKPSSLQLKNDLIENSKEEVSPHVEVKVSKPVIGHNAIINEGSTRMKESPVSPNDANNLSSAPVLPISHLFRSAMETCISKLQAHSLQH